MKTIEEIKDAVKIYNTIEIKKKGIPDGWLDRIAERHMSVLIPPKTFSEFMFDKLRMSRTVVLTSEEILSKKGDVLEKILREGNSEGSKEQVLFGIEILNSIKEQEEKFFKLIWLKINRRKVSDRLYYDEKDSKNETYMRIKLAIEDIDNEYFESGICVSTRFDIETKTKIDELIFNIKK